MSSIDVLNHLLGFFLPALGIGTLAAALVKALWHDELRGVRWARLASWSGGAAALASMAGLVVFGRDGMMATYGTMVVASALALSWAGFGPGRR